MNDRSAGNVRHFLALPDLSPGELRSLLHRAIELKQMQRSGRNYEPLRNRVLGMVFEKSSTRTRVSFETAMIQFGGGAIFLSPRDTQLGRGEPVEDTARVLSRMVDAVMLRTFTHESQERFASCSQAPVINGLSDTQHPCQLLADLQTWIELRGEIEGRVVAWIGDGNNMCNSYIDAARMLGFTLRIASPRGYEPRLPENCEPAQITILEDPHAAADGADLVVTDVWASMGQEDEAESRNAAFRPYQVNETLMSRAAADALFMHCLPAHRGEEVSAGVIDGAQSVVWQEAENRLHAQKALLEFLLVGTPA
ncbi:MAG: ornithine carbamoyltransferase [Gammaproteobacteria bacterium]|jgi:ornithine carbamoyltransferase|nr:ornithine carbamoyltransferase [Gammaproteobacteria bacterium]